MSCRDTAKPSQQKPGSKDRPWVPRFWSGITLWPWLSLLARNRFKINLICWPMALILTSLAAINSLLALLQRILYERRIRATRLCEDPIFVIGHWRSGTTLLHELLVLDSRFTYPDTYAAFAPNHFLISAWLFKPLLWILLPARRPMDNMSAGWDRPQEDEFALCNMGCRSPYLTIAFPNRPQDPEYLDLHDVAAEGQARWKQSLLRFLQCLTLVQPKRIVLKSPPHTARMRILLEMFPKAKFVHIVRSPYALFPSTLKLWRTLYKDQGLQVPKHEGLEEQTFQTLLRMYDALDRDCVLVPKGQFCEVRYEDLIARPIDEVRKIYERLELGGFDKMQPALEAYFAEKADYKTDRYQLPPEVRAEIDRRWRFYLERYGYAVEPAQAKCA